MVLVDTCVWIDHFRQKNEALQRLLRFGNVVMHEYVIGEAACGHLQRRDEVLEMFARLPVLSNVQFKEALHFIDANALAGSGLNFVDMHLLAACKLVPGVTLWTLDRRLQDEAHRLAVRHHLH